MDWSIQEVARLAGTTSRTLRHYHQIGLLIPSRIAPNGYRYYDQDRLVLLQRILLLRELGLGLDQIQPILDSSTETPTALADHMRWLLAERSRLDRQITAVRTTIHKLEGGEQLMAEEILDGFDHTQYQDEVEQRWGKQAYADSNRWWRDLGRTGQRRFLDASNALMRAWGEIRAAGLRPDSPEAQAVAQRQYDWLAGIPGTPGADQGGPTREYFEGLADMYVADPRFTANYDTYGEGTAALVRDAMHHYAQQNLA